MREDWIEVISSEILDIRDGTHDTPKYIQDEVHPLVTSKNLKQGVLDLTNVKYISEEDFIEINKRSKVDIGDVLFAMIGTIGNPVVIKKEPHYSIKNVGLFKNRFKVIDSNLLGYFLDSTTFYHQLQEKQFLKGTTQKFIPLGHLRKIALPLPPLVEQKTIVKKIEELFSSLDSGIADLKKAQDQLVIYRQAVLKKAFEGAYSNKQYKVQTIKSLCAVVRGGSPRPAGSELFYNGPIPFMKVKDISRNEGVFVKQAEHSIKEAGLKKTRLVNPNTLLLTNSGATLGIPAITAIETTFNDGIAAFLNLDDDLLYHYYYWCSKTIYLRNLNQGAGQPNLNTDVIGKMEIPIYNDKNEHSKIVQEIESRLSVCDKVEKDIADSLKKAQALRQSILKKAFEGKLLSEDEIAKCKADAAYEPASVLLERIKKEKFKK